MRWLRARGGAAWGPGPFDATAVRVLLDPRVMPYVARRAPAIDAAVARGERLGALHDGASLLREVHGGWLAGGVRARGDLPERAARALLDGWRRPALPRGPAGGDVAAVVTLVVASRGGLLLGDHAVTGEDVRSALEAFGGLLRADLLDLALVSDGPLVGLAEAPRALPDPPLVAIAPFSPEQRFCPACALPVPSELAHCPACAAALAA